MTIPLKTGMAAATLIIEHLCRVLRAYRPTMDAVITQAVVGSVITTAQAEILRTFLNSAQTACDIIRVITGY